MSQVGWGSVSDTAVCQGLPGQCRLTGPRRSPSAHPRLLKAALDGCRHGFLTRERAGVCPVVQPFKGVSLNIFLHFFIFAGQNY